MANDVKLKLAIEGGEIVVIKIDGVGDSLDRLEGSARKAATGAGSVGSAFGEMAAAMTVANLASKALEVGVQNVGNAIDYLMDSAKKAARFETLGVVMQTVGRNAGYTGQQMMDAARGVQALGITMLESRDSVTKMASAQIDLANASKLARVAQDAAVIGGINSSESLKAMVYGIQSAQTDVLRTIGINVSFEESYKKLAKQLGTTSEALSEQEKTTARVNAVLESGTKIAGAYEDAMGTAGKQLTSIARYAEDAQVKLGAVFNETLLLAVATYTDHLKGTNQELDDLAANKSLEEWSQTMAQTFAFVADSLKNSFSVITTVIDTIYTAMKQANALASFRFGDVMSAGDDWQARMGDRFDPNKQAQVQLANLQASREQASRTLTYGDKTKEVFATEADKSFAKDMIGAANKIITDQQGANEKALTATAALVKKGRTDAQKIADELKTYRATQTAGGISLDDPGVKAAEAAIKKAHTPRAERRMMPGPCWHQRFPITSNCKPL